MFVLAILEYKIIKCLEFELSECKKNIKMIKEIM